MTFAWQLGWQYDDAATLQGNTPWVAPACADCPGFLVLVSAPAPATTLVSKPQIVPWASILLYGPLGIAWVCCPQLPHHPCKNGTHSTMFLEHKGAHAERYASTLHWQAIVARD